MIARVAPRLFRRSNAILLLLSVALVCVPLAGREIVRDAALTLLLPVTLFAAGLAWWLASSRQNAPWRTALAALAGPLLLYVYVSGMGPLLVELFRQSLLLFPRFFTWSLAPLPQDVASWMAAASILSSQAGLLAARTGAWLVEAVQGVSLADPSARAFVWSAGLWLISAWAGWQVRRYNRILSGLLPFTILLGLILSSNSKPMFLLWIHLGMLLLLLGFGTMEQHIRTWVARSGHDYVEMTGIYALVTTTLLAGLLVAAAYLVGTDTVKDFFDRLREQRRTTVAAEGTPSGKKDPDLSVRQSPSAATELLRPHRVGAAPELSNDVFMVISTGDLPKMPRYANPTPVRYYWRTITYETYNGRGWSNARLTLRDVPSGQELTAVPVENYHLVHQQVRFPAGPSGALYWTGLLQHVDEPVQAAWYGKSLPDGQPAEDSDLLSAFITEDGYSADSLKLEVTADQLRRASAIYPDSIAARYLALPASVPERVLALARQLTGAAATPYDRALAIESYLRQFPYSLEVPAPPGRRDATDYFLFELKEGYCDYYATAMVVLSRAAGLPARFVTGYSTGYYDAESASYLVRRADAHAWAEIYFPGAGWVEFEPTASQPLPDRKESGALPKVPPIAEQPKKTLLERLVLNLSDLVARLWFILPVSLGIVVVWILGVNLILPRLQPERLPARLYHSLRRAARPLTGGQPSSQTPHEYARQLSQHLSAYQSPWIRSAGEELDDLTEIYARSLFAALPPSRPQIRAATHSWARLRWRLLWACILRLARRTSL